MSDTYRYLRPGCIIKLKDKTFCIRRMLNASIAEVIDIDSGDIRQASVHDFDEVLQVDVAYPRSDLLTLDENDWMIALQRYKAIQSLLKKPRTKQSVQATANEAKVDLATIYRWLSRFESTGEISSLVPRSRQDVGKPRVEEEAETIMKSVIQNVFLNDQAVSPTRAYRDVLIRCREAGISPPHFSTFRRRINNLTPATLSASREGKKAARRFHLVKGAFPNADYPYAVLQIDHTTVDLILVDDNHRLPIQRPYITVAIDVFSRMIAGYYISFDPPGTLGTAMCIANAVLSKKKLLEEEGIKYNWPCQGLPRVIHVDNAKEFRGNALNLACNQHCIDLQFRPVRKPNYGGHIERLMGTLMNEIHSLPGTTRSRSHDLGEYNPEKKAALTLKEFEQWFANLVLGTYHHRIHSEIGMPPISKFEHGIKGDSFSPGTGYPPLPTDEESFRTDFLPFEYRTIQPYGIAVDGIYYQGDILSRWVGAVDPKKTSSKRKFLIRRDPRDISFILFFDPELKRYFRLPYQNPNYPPISLWELKAVVRHLKLQGRKAENQDIIFAAFKEMQQIEESAKKETKTTRILRARRENRIRKNNSLPDTTQTNDSTLRVNFNVSNIKPFDDVEDT